MAVVAGVVLAGRWMPDAGLVVADGRVISGFLPVSSEPDAETHADHRVAHGVHSTPEVGVPHTGQVLIGDW